MNELIVYASVKIEKNNPCHILPFHESIVVSMENYTRYGETSEKCARGIE